MRKDKGISRPAMLAIAVAVGLIVLLMSTNLLQIGGEGRIVLDFCSDVQECENVARENGATDDQVRLADIQCSDGVCTSKVQDERNENIE